MHNQFGCLWELGYDDGVTEMFCSCLKPKQLLDLEKHIKEECEH